MTNHFCQFQFLNPRVYCSPYLDIFLGCDTWLINPILDTGASRSSFPRLWTMTALPVAPSQVAPSCGGFSWLFFYSLSRRSSTSVVPIPGLKTTPLAAWPHRWPPLTLLLHICVSDSLQPPHLAVRQPLYVHYIQNNAKPSLAPNVWLRLKPHKVSPTLFPRP